MGYTYIINIGIKKNSNGIKTNDYEQEKKKKPECVGDGTMRRRPLPARRAADLGYQLYAVATQPQDIAGTGNPPSTKVIASDMTAAVVKKDNFGTLTDAAYTLYDTDKVDYVKVELTNAQTGVEYMVVASVRKVPE